MTVDIKLNTIEIEAQLEKQKQKAQKLLDHMVLRDSDKYAPDKSGTLRKKGFDTVLGSGLVIWNVPYAKEVYHAGGTPRQLKNPNARRKWFEVAKSRFRDKWVRLVNDGFGK